MATELIDTDDELRTLDRYALHCADFSMKIIDRRIDVAAYERETAIDEYTPFDLIEQAHRLSAMASACQLAAMMLLARKPAKRERRIAA